MAKVMIVEDEVVFGESLRGLLIRTGHDICLVSNGEEALIVADSFAPDVLIVDWMLKQQMNGLDVATEIHSKFNNLQTIIISGYSAMDLREQTKGFNTFAILEKPIDVEEVRRVLHEAIASSSNRAAEHA